MKRLLVFGIFLFLSSFGFVQQSTAANFTVNDATSLIAAITTANSNGVDDVISFSANIALTVASDFTEGANGLPSILPDGGSSLTIEGNGFTLSRSGAAAFRMMHITAGANVFINDLTIEGGLANAGGIGSMGGAIFTWGQITIDNSIFTGNVADDGSNGLGGAIAPVDTTATITNSTFASNSAMSNSGGAILSTRVNLTLIGNTFTNNGARSGGGLGIQDGNITLVNNTFSGNTATFQGGGISNNFSVILVMRNNTITNNSAGTSGGGVYNAFFGVTTLHNNIIAGNTAPSGSQCFNDTTVSSTVINADSYNIFGTGGNAGGCPAGATDIVPTGAISTIISPLSSNGGATLTHALPISSPALDAANLANCPTADQRGFLRGFNGVGGVNSPQIGDCDIGAFEFSLTPAYASTPAVGATLNFGSTPVGTEISTILEIRETGGASLLVSLNSITGTNASDFSIIGLPTTIGDTNPPQNIALICTPSASGLRTAQITFSTNDPILPLVNYNLECTGINNIVASASIIGINQVVTEGATTVNATVKLDVPAGFSDTGNVVVQITDATTGNATSGADYTAFPPTNVTFTGPLTTGTYTQTVSVNILDDPAIEGAEALALEINSVTGAGEIGFPDTHTIVINDNDVTIFAQASFVDNSAIINENAGTLTIDVQLFIPVGFNLTGDITLTISDSLGGTATSGADYTAFAPVILTFIDAPFVAGTTYTQPVTLNILDDNLIEGVETVDFGITGISGGVELISPAQFTAIINDFELTFNPAYNSNPAVGTTINFGSTPIGTEISTILEIIEAGDADLSVSLNSITGTHAGDFSIIGLPTTIADASPSQNIAIICTPSASGLRTAQITFNTNDATQPTVTYNLECIGTDNIVASASIIGINQVVTEGDTGINLTVALDVPVGFSDTGDVTVEIMDSGVGNAVSGTDYTPFPTTTFTFAGPLTAGVNPPPQTINVPVTIVNDPDVEGAEAFAIEISQVTGVGAIGFPDTHTIVINDDDADTFAQASFVGNSAIINENAGTLTIDVQLFIPVGFNLTGDITLTISDSLGGTATSGADYTAFAPVILTFIDAPFVAGTTYTQPVTLNILDDSLSEGVETIDLGITGISGGVELISPAQFTAIINDDEISTVIVTQPGGTVTVPIGDPEFVVKTVDNPFATIGQTVTYTIQARNPKTIPLTQVVIYDVFDERLSDIRLISTTHGKGVFSGNTLIVSGFTLQPNEEAIIIVSAQVAALKVGDTIPNAAILESPDASVHVSNLALVGANATGNSGDASQVFVIPNQLPNTGENPGWRNVILWAGGFLLVLSAGLLIWVKRTKQHA